MYMYMCVYTCIPICTCMCMYNVCMYACMYMPMESLTRRYQNIHRNTVVVYTCADTAIYVIYM